jgi:hypothetical protein
VIKKVKATFEHTPNAVKLIERRERVLEDALHVPPVRATVTSIAEMCHVATIQANVPAARFQQTQ